MNNQNTAVLGDINAGKIAKEGKFERLHNLLLTLSGSTATNSVETQDLKVVLIGSDNEESNETCGETVKPQASYVDALIELAEDSVREVNKATNSVRAIRPQFPKQF
ncbi:hypothetical protein [Vibrio sp. ER1A]|uniref:hypothetical protein n=1 Tax=Vibrio sp. ER1A TaxID=1517681 RepID=UPI0004DD5029|nr:hypothetical protein [Vibrio sp. ER1A]KFA99462.1 hypothetical protein HW45_03630 [Vibrio sp. ER1A]